MRSPAEYFTKYLISMYPDSEVVEQASGLRIWGVTLQEVQRLRREMQPLPDPYDPADPNNLATRQYLRKHGIHDLWYRTPAVNEAILIVNDPTLRASLEKLLLSPLKISEIVHQLTTQEFPLSNEGVQAFSHYFWNKKLLSPEEWGVFINERPGSYARTVALAAPADTAALVVPWVAGVSGLPANIGTGQVARRIRDVAFMKILEIERMPANLAHSKMMLNYSKIVKDMEGELRQSDVALKDVLKAFDKFRLRKDTRDIPSIEEVAGPNFSQSGEGTDTSRMIQDDDYDKGDPEYGEPG